MPPLNVFEQLDYLLLYKSFTQPGESFEITWEELKNDCSRSLADFLSRWRLAPDIESFISSSSETISIQSLGGDAPRMPRLIINLGYIFQQISIDQK